jgi:CheY-like chemotaxis protein
VKFRERGQRFAVFFIERVMCRRLLIADDSPEMRWLIRSMLGHKFGEVAEAADGRELFWQLLRAAYIEDRSLLVIADVYMPIYDGLQVLDAFRYLGFDLPLLVISAFPNDHIRERVARLGVPMLPKPFTGPQLERAVAELRAGA